MIPHLHRWQSHYGASHRKNFDTPSLKGLRLEPKWFRLEPNGKESSYDDGQISAVPDGTAHLA